MSFGLKIGLATLFSGGLLTYPVYQAELAKRAQQRAARDQQTAELEARNRALSQERKNAMAIKASNQKRPAVDALLNEAMGEGSKGLASTMLTSFYGVDPVRGKLSPATLLGE